MRENGKSTWLSLNKNNQVKCVLRDLNQQTPFLFGTFKCVCWLWGEKSSWVPKSNGPTYLLEKCFSSGGKVCFRFGLGTVVAGYEGCANNTFVFVMKEKKLEEKTLKKHQSATTLTWYLHFSCVCNKTWPLHLVWKQKCVVAAALDPWKKKNDWKRPEEITRHFWKNVGNLFFYKRKKTLGYYLK